ncbi:serpin family protein [Bacillus licheniformis]|nr:serpin family protein [Bacillus licheniformis]
MATPISFKLILIGQQRKSTAGSKETKDRIDQIVDKVSSNTIAYIINAVYFKESWKHPFDPHMTAEQPFIQRTAPQKTPHDDADKPLSLSGNEHFKPSSCHFKTKACH